MAQPFSLLSACLQQPGQLRLDRASAVRVAEEEGRDGIPLTANMEILEGAQGKVWFLSSWCNSIFNSSMSHLRWMIGLMFPQLSLMCVHLVLVQFE